MAAAMTARVAIERALTRTVLRHPQFGTEWRGLEETACWLRNRHLLRLRMLHRILTAAAIGNAAAHGKTVTRAEVNEIVSVAFILDRHL
jgi:hypothetical protein